MGLEKEILEKNHNNRIGLYVFSSIVLIIMGYISSKLNNIPIIEATETSKEVYLPINWFYFYSMCFFVTIVFLYFILRFKNKKRWSNTFNGWKNYNFNNGSIILFLFRKNLHYLEKNEETISKDDDREQEWK